MWRPSYSDTTKKTPVGISVFSYIHYNAKWLISPWKPAIFQKIGVSPFRMDSYFSHVRFYCEYIIS